MEVLVAFEEAGAASLHSSAPDKDTPVIVSALQRVNALVVDPRAQRDLFPASPAAGGRGGVSGASGASSGPRITADSVLRSPLMDRSTARKSSGSER